jgi:excisionase family DNA binding protein
MNTSPDAAVCNRFNLVGNGYDPDRLLTVEDMARRLQVSAAWVRDHATRKRPRLPVVRVGKLLRFRREEIEQWIRDQSQRPW